MNEERILQALAENNKVVLNRLDEQTRDIGKILTVQSMLQADVKNLKAVVFGNDQGKAGLMETVVRLDESHKQCKERQEVVRTQTGSIQVVDTATPQPQLIPTPPPWLFYLMCLGSLGGSLALGMIKWKS